MLASFRRLSKSTVGSIVLVLFVLAIVASFALADISNIGAGSLGSGSSSSLAKAGNQQITDRDMSRAMERRLTQVRQQNPEADYSTIAGDFDAILASLIDQAALQAFADKHGFVVSKRLIDAEIATIPGTRGLDGKFSEQAYALFLAQQRMTDQEVRQLIANGILQRMLLTPVATNARVPVGMARPYASMLLEAREGEFANVPNSAFRAGLKPTDADVQRFYAANRGRYMIPEQRVLRLARIGPEQVAGVAASEQEIAAYYNANQATYGAKEIRVISQAVVPDQAGANAIAQRARGGASFVAAAAPAGLSAADISVGPQTRSEFAALAGDRVAAAAFATQSGAIVGPVQSDLGWHVVKVDSIRREGGKPLAAARAEIAARLTAEKRKEALTDLVTTIEDAISEGSNFTEAAAKAKLQVTETPLITVSGSALGNPSFRLPPELAPALRSGFELAQDDEPVVETLANEESYVLVAPSRIAPAAPAPLASIRARVAEDWINQQAADRARAVANTIAAKAARGVPLAKAVAEAGVSLPLVRPVAARRLDLSQMGANVPAPVRMLFSLGAGKSRVVADPQQRGFSVVKVNRIVPGNALNQPALIGRVQNEFQEAVAEEYAGQFLAAVRAAVGVRRNEGAIAATKQRISGS
ncbi:peptidylprolyl isomerase [Sphingomonas sp.]|uniref:peptidylprolyl isomerase n=1 Tax=Sphingomonas sp. TaxID=28214 RepID=UPI0017F7C338|nr:peptidylprolyl isomerase [Sphingomonas sp.]MBA3512097.1 peptidylprolyl isomerase [Sphingomonas sp.]